MADFLQGVLKAFGPTGEAAEGFVRDVLLPLMSPEPVRQDGNVLQRAVDLGGKTSMLGTVGPKNIGAMKHAAGAASPEAFKRLAGGTRFFRVNRAGKATPMLDVSDVDKAAKAVRPGEAIVRVSPNGEQIVEGGSVANRAMQEAIEGLRPGAARNVDSGVHQLHGEGIEDAIDFLKSLGVEIDG